ncbi:hypothetical protein SLEP1_g38719 [Rubroshorea leprosula]|uniref:Protein kinase domain-containing protein n=1 Tax=Rubroshorea leprosula TaxID=152421 RepID=A0AAV5KYC3_9ROSI|nr:hypothetical protein SLEP1_g38719 [Rubroshorea leprosula]
MNLKDPLIVTLVLFLLVISTQAAKCDRSCGGKRLQYPFGFSAGCKIPLNCSNSSIMVNNFRVIDVNSDSIRISIQPKCNRSLQAFHDLYGKNYAPSSRNAILLDNCGDWSAQCAIPNSMVRTRFETGNCSSNSSNNISCYMENRPDTDGFVNYNKLSRCRYFLSVISAEPFNDAGVSLDVRILELGWWIEGDKCQCSGNANCTKISTPNGHPGFRCKCKEGFVGDGYHAGSGCRKDCTLAKFLSGKCGGTIRVVVLVVGIATGASLIVCIGLLCWIMKRRSSTKSRNIIKRWLSAAKGANISIPIYPYKEIEKATNNFSEKQRLGRGAYGTVYAGKLSNDLCVAIKRINNRGTDSIEQVMNEIKLLSTVSHPNLVRLLGCSIDRGEQILVYEFMPNGTLCQHLQRERGDGLPWEVRLAIASETAQAIAHLHSAIDPPIYHRDIKSSNILLDCNFRSKVADFGLSRLGKTEISHISTAPQGTPGYVDPQYHQNFHLSDKSDVYSFGVVLVEIITALKAVDFSRPPNEINLAALATDRIIKDRLDEIIDPFIELQSDAWTSSSVHKVAEIAFRCLSFHRDMRPTMNEVAMELEQIRLSRSPSLDEITRVVSNEDASSPSSSSSNLSEQPLNVKMNKEGGGLLMLNSSIGSVRSMERLKGNSPVSVQDPWLSERSSPSSNSLLSNAIY